jgi:hypothetical protein
MPREFFIPELQHRNPNFGDMFFQQDGATSHTSLQTRQLLQQTFPNHVISRFGDTEWPPRSPDFTASDFFLWGYLKSKVYASKPNNLGDLKTAIRNEIQLISNETLAKVMAEVLVRSQECIRFNGGYLKSVILKNRQCLYFPVSYYLLI